LRSIFRGGGAEASSDAVGLRVGPVYTITGAIEGCRGPMRPCFAGPSWKPAIIASGEAVVEISPSRRVVLKEGDFFGEMALLEHRRHKHDVVAKTRCRLYVLDSGSLARLGRRHPERMESIRKMAEARAVDDEPAHREDRKRKVGAKG